MQQTVQNILPNNINQSPLHWSESFLRTLFLMQCSLTKKLSHGWLKLLLANAIKKQNYYSGDEAAFLKYKQLTLATNNFGRP